MAYDQKKYNRINWQNRPSTATALGATNLNKMDNFLNDVDNALMSMETAKLDKTTANTMIKSVEYTKETGKWVFTELNGTTHEFDQNVEKIPAKFELKPDGKLVMTTDDGETYEASIANVIKPYDFEDTDTIDFTKTDPADAGDLTKEGTYTVKAIVKEGSIEGKHLNPDYKTQIDQLKNDAESAAADSLQYSKDAKRYAVGDEETVPESATDNAKYYYENIKESAKTASEQAQAASESAQTATEQAGIATEQATSATASAASAKEDAATATEKAEIATQKAESASADAATATANAEAASASEATATEAAKQAQASQAAASESETNAAESATQAEASAKRAEEVSAVEIMTAERNGIGKPDSETISVDGDGTLSVIADASHITATDTNSLLTPEVEGITTQKLLDEISSRIVNKLVDNDKFTTTLAQYVTKAMISSVDTENADKIPSSAFIHTLKGMIDQNTAAISTLNSAKAYFHLYSTGSTTATINFTGAVSRCALICSYVENGTNAANGKFGVIRVNAGGNAISAVNSETFTVAKGGDKSITVLSLQAWSPLFVISPYPIN